MAAGIGLAAVGTWRVLDTGRDPGSAVVRGWYYSLAVTTENGPTGWRARWPAAPAAAIYRIRVFAADGQVLLEREVTDTGFHLAADSLPTRPAAAAIYLEVEAFDAMRRPITRSSLMRLRPPRDST